MPEIGTSGSMSEDGKRGVAEWPKLPRPSSTLPSRRFAATPQYVRIFLAAIAAVEACVRPRRGRRGCLEVKARAAELLGQHQQVATNVPSRWANDPSLGDEKKPKRGRKQRQLAEAAE
jgi:hypothetical protein